MIVNVFSPRPLSVRLHAASIIAAMVLATDALGAQRAEHAHNTPAAPGVPAAGQSRGERKEDSTQRSAEIPLLSRAPRIDGRIDAGEWDQARSLSGFVQLEPAEGTAASEATEVLVGRSEHTLYLAFIAHDGDMAKVRAKRTPRDAFANVADYVGIVIDPRMSGTRAQFFYFNPLGGQYDGTWSGDLDFSWDGVLRSAGTVGADRYVVEVAIPFSTITGAASGRSAWSVNIVRVVSRKSEESWWRPRSRAQRTNVFSEFGTFTGVTEPGSAKGVTEVIPTVIGSSATRGTSWPGSTNSVGVTAREMLGPWARLEATWHPDFSAVAADAPQLAFGERYALYYPEKRPFFLEGADQFAVPRAHMDSDPMRLLHTRTIGQARDGARVLLTPPGGFLGAMFVRQDSLTGGHDGSTAVFRAIKRGPNSSRFGVLATHRDHETAGENDVLSADAQIHLIANSVLTAQAAGSSTHDTTGTRRALAWYLDLARDNGSSFQQITYRRVPPAFAADAGFIPRTDMQQVVGHIGRYWRPKGRALLYVLPMYQVVEYWTGDGRRTDRDLMPHVEFGLTRATSITMAWRYGDEEFRGTRHNYSKYGFWLNSAPRTWLDLVSAVTFGSRVRYDGDLTHADRSYSARYAELKNTLNLKAGASGSVEATVAWRRFAGNGLTGASTMSAREVWVGQVVGTYQLDNQSFVRVTYDYDADMDRGAGSVLLGRELNYGTQAHVGFRWQDIDAVGGNSTATSQTARLAFVRLSYLWRR